jgi:hypothetical protein
VTWLGPGLGRGFWRAPVPPLTWLHVAEWKATKVPGGAGPAARAALHQCTLLSRPALRCKGADGDRARLASSLQPRERGALLTTPAATPHRPQSHYAMPIKVGSSKTASAFEQALVRVAGALMLTLRSCVGSMHFHASDMSCDGRLSTARLLYCAVHVLSVFCHCRCHHRALTAPVVLPLMSFSCCAP